MSYLPYLGVGTINIGLEFFNFHAMRCLIQFATKYRLSRRRRFAFIPNDGSVSSSSPHNKGDEREENFEYSSIKIAAFIINSDHNLIYKKDRKD
jgi:hypothetical protein